MNRKSSVNELAQMFSKGQNVDNSNVPNAPSITAQIRNRKFDQSSANTSKTHEFSSKEKFTQKLNKTQGSSDNPQPIILGETSVINNTIKQNKHTSISLKKPAVPKSELSRKYNIHKDSSVRTNIQPKMVDYAFVDNTTTQSNLHAVSSNKMVTSKREFSQKNIMHETVLDRTNIKRTMFLESSNNNSTTTQNSFSSNSSNKRILQKEDLSQRINMFENASGNNNMQTIMFPQSSIDNSTTTDNIHSSISSEIPVASEKSFLRRLKNFEDSSASSQNSNKNINKQNAIPMSSDKSMVNVKQFSEKKDKIVEIDKQKSDKQFGSFDMKSDRTSQQINTVTQLINSQIKKSESSTIKEEIQVDDIADTKNSKTENQYMYKLIENQQMKSSRRQYKGKSTYNVEEIPDNDNGNREEITVVENKDINGEQKVNHVENIQKDINTEVIENKLDGNHFYKTKIFAKEETQERNDEETVDTSKDTNTPEGYLRMYARQGNKPKEENKVVSSQEDKNLKKENDRFANIVAGARKYLEQYTSSTSRHNSEEYFGKDIKEGTDTYDDEYVYPVIETSKHEYAEIEERKDGIPNGDLWKNISELRFDKSKSARDTFLSLQTNETLSDIDDREQWLDLYATQQNVASIFQETSDSINEHMSLTDILKKYDSDKISWKDLMNKMQLNIINTMTPVEIEAQDAKLYLVRKELLYLEALNVLNNHFVSKLVLFISENELKILFGNLKEVINCSQKLIKDIEECWKSNVVMPDFGDVLCKNLIGDFSAYIYYCENQSNFEKKLETIISDRKRQFKEILDVIQLDPICRGLHLHAYMLLPIQKIHRFSSLIDNILQHFTPADNEYEQFQTAVDLTNILLKCCTNALKDKENWSQTLKITTQLEFPKNTSVENLGVSEKRRIILSGEVDMIEMNNSLFGKKTTKKRVHLFLFNDLLVIGRKNSKDKYTVLQYCLRIYIDIESDLASMPYHELLDLNHSFLIKMNERIPKEILISCKTTSDKVRLCQSLDPSEEQIANKSARYFQVSGEYNYKLCQYDEISFNRGDILDVYQNIEDRWYYGENTRTAEVGWFPAHYVFKMEVN